MAFNNRGVNAYRNVSVASAVPYADSVQLIQMLFDGLMTCLADAEGHFERMTLKENMKALERRQRF
jgi:flagellar protein FliS